jgi:hypothetical protein
MRAGHTAEPGLACRIGAARRVMEADSILALADLTNNQIIYSSEKQVDEDDLALSTQWSGCLVTPTIRYIYIYHRRSDIYIS